MTALCFILYFGHINNHGHNFGMFVGKLVILHVLRCLRFTVNDDYFHTFSYAFVYNAAVQQSQLNRAHFPGLV